MTDAYREYSLIKKGVFQRASRIIHYLLGYMWSKLMAGFCHCHSLGRSAATRWDALDGALSIVLER